MASIHQRGKASLPSSAHSSSTDDTSVPTDITSTSGKRERHPHTTTGQHGGILIFVGVVCLLLLLLGRLFASDSGSVAHHEHPSAMRSEEGPFVDSRPSFSLPQETITESASVSRSHTFGGYTQSAGGRMPRFDQQQQQQPSSQQQSKGRQIERTAHVSTSVSRGTMAKATDTLRQVAVEHGGYVAQERSSWSGLEAGATGFSHGWADLTLKVPSNQLNAAIERVRHVGRIVSFRQSSREVTNAFESSDLRSVLSQRDVDSHLALLRSATKDPATNDEQMLQLLAKLTQYEQSVIEEQVTKRRLKDSVEYATIEVHVEELALGTKPNPRNGWQWPSPLSLLSLGLVAVVVLLILRQLYLHRWVVPFVYHAARDTGSTARTAFEVMTQNFAMQMTTSASPQFRPDRGEKEVGEPEKKDDECSSAAAGGSNGTFSHEPAAAFAPSPPQQSS